MSQEYFFEGPARADHAMAPQPTPSPMHTPTMGDDACGTHALAAGDAGDPRDDDAWLPLTPSTATPAARDDLSWRCIQSRLQAAGVRGHDAAVRYLSLVGSTPYREHGPRVRALVTAPTSSGKSFLLEAYAKAANLPYLLVDASAISPEGWQGIGVSDVLAAAYQRAGRDLAVLERGVVLVLDEIDKAVRGVKEDVYGSAVRRDRQAAMLQLVWGGTPVTFSSNASGAPLYDLQVRTDKWIVIASGAFADAGFTRDGRVPTDDDLVGYGMMPELASRLTTRMILPSRSTEEIAQLIRSSGDGLDAITAVCARLGYSLHVTDGAVARVAAAVAAGQGGLTLRVGTQLLVDASNAALMQALHDGVCPGTCLLVTPDDVPLPSRSRAGV